MVLLSKRNHRVQLRSRIAFSARKKDLDQTKEAFSKYLKCAALSKHGVKVNPKQYHTSWKILG